MKGIERRIDFFTILFLGLATILTSLSSWQSNLYQGMQMSSYTNANIKYNDGSSDFLVGYLDFCKDMDCYKEIKNIEFELNKAKRNNDQEQVDELERRIEENKEYCLTDIAKKIIEDSNQDEFPFNDETSEYYLGAGLKDLNTSKEIFKEGELYNDYSDAFNLATIIYSLALFFLGLLGTMHNLKSKLFLLISSVALIFVGACYTFSVPMIIK